MPTELKIVSLEIENIKCIKAVRIEPNGAPVVTIGGKNGAGKSTVLDSLEMAFRGKKADPERPIRDGEGNARIAVDLDAYHVERKLSRDGKGSLVVRSKDGARFPSPQALLDKMYGDLAFDPLAFSRMPAKEQAETLRKLTGLDFTGHDVKRIQVFEDRTNINRDVKGLKARLDGMLPIFAGAPDEEESVADLSRRVVQSQEASAALRAHHSHVSGVQLQVKLRAEQIAELKAFQKEDMARLKELDSKALVDPDPIEPLQHAIENLEEVNGQVRANAARKELEAEHVLAEQTSEDLTATLESMDADKTEQIADAQLPVRGLVFDAEGVTLDGIPFAQLATSEKIKASVAIGIAMKPDLPLMLVRDGSLLDVDGKAIIHDLAQAAGITVLMECVGTSGDVTVLIEDGEVVEAGQ